MKLRSPKSQVNTSEPSMARACIKDGSARRDIQEVLAS